MNRITSWRTTILGAVVFPLAVWAVAAGQQRAGRPSGAAASQNAQSNSGAAASSIAFWPARQYAFEIPFQASVSPEALPFAIVQLYVWAADGRNWQFYASELPSSEKFSFKAPRDGEYWFATQTVDTRRPPPPPSAMTPQLRVLVDTLKPQIELAATRGPSGEIRAQWRISDKYLLPQSLKIEYQTAPGQPWTPVAIEIPTDQQSRTNLTGSIAWWPKGVTVGDSLKSNRDSASILVRAEIRDWAGNPEAVSRRVTMQAPRASAAVKAPFSFPRTTPTAETPSQQTPRFPAMGRTGDSASTPPSGDPFLRRQAPATRTLTDRQPNNDREIPWPAGTTPGTPVPPPNTNQVRPLSEDAETSSSEKAIAANEGRFHSVASPPRDDTPKPGAPGNSLPAGERPRMISSRRFQLDYDVDKVGPSGVGSVELWYTRDNGRSWHSYGFDADRKSPFDVQVDSEDVYGFRVVIESGRGLAGHLPQSGDAADLWVAVDWTQPSARITSAIYGVGAQAGRLAIGWQAEDTHLAERPITLKFSDAPEGPWTTIVSGLAHTSNYDWKVDPRTPPKIYLQLEVRDKAGNVAIHRLDQPINIEGLAPKGRIRGIRPLEDIHREASR